jgi:hypothetical protein
MIEKKRLAHLTPSARDWVLTTQDVFALEPHHEALVLAGGEALARAERARQQIELDGMMIASARGLRAHPLLAIERDAALMFARIVKQLKFDGDGRKSAPLPGARSHKLRVV